MTPALAIAVAICTIISAAGVIYGLSQTAKSQARAAAKEIAEAKEKYGAQKYADGVASQADRILLLTSQRDDARRARDDNATRANNFENLYLQLQNTRRNGGQTS